MPKTLDKPTTSSANKLKVSVSISPSLLARLDRHAEEVELSRSTVIQIALHEYLAK